MQIAELEVAVAEAPESPDPPELELPKPPEAEAEAVSVASVTRMAELVITLTKPEVSAAPVGNDPSTPVALAVPVESAPDEEEEDDASLSSPPRPIPLGIAEVRLPKWTRVGVDGSISVVHVVSEAELSE